MVSVEDAKFPGGFFQETHGTLSWRFQVVESRGSSGHRPRPEQTPYSRSNGDAPGLSEPRLRPVDHQARIWSLRDSVGKTTADAVQVNVDTETDW